MSGFPFDSDNCIPKSDVTPGQWSAIDQNVSQARAFVTELTRLQAEHVRDNHETPAACHTPCTSSQVIAMMDTLTEDAAKMVLHMIVCDAANVLVRRE